MPRKSQNEKPAEAAAERPVTRRSVRLSASSVASPELTKSCGKDSVAKVVAISPSKTSSSPSGSKATETRSASSSKAASRGKAKVENEAVKEVKAEEEQNKEEPTDEDLSDGHKKRGRQAKGKSGSINAKDKEADGKKESEKDSGESAKGTKEEDSKDNQATLPSCTGRRRRCEATVTPASDKTLTPPRRCARGRGKEATEEASQAVSTSCQGTKWKRGDNDCRQENEDVDNLTKKQKTENVEDVNVEKMEIDTQGAGKPKDFGEGPTEILEEEKQQPNIPSGDPKILECEKTNLDEKAECGETLSASETVSAAGADAVDVRENGLRQADEVMMESNSEAVAFKLDASKDAQETTSSSDKTADALGNRASDVLCSRKFVWFQGDELPSSDSHSAFAVVSYNILADCHAQRDYTEPGSWIAKEHLAIGYRHERIMKEIRFLDGDIICFQEVGTDYFTSMLKPALAELGYDGLYVPRHTTIYSEGEATFFRTKRFSLESSESLILSQVAEKEIDESGIEPDVKNSVKESVESYAVALLMRFKCLNSETSVACANIHVAYDEFKRQDKQCLQLACAIRELVKFAGGPDKPHFICGDFNSWPDSPPYQLVHDGHLSEKSLTALQSINTISQSDGQLAPLVNYWSEGFQCSPADNLQSAYMEVLGKEPLTSRFHSDGIVRSVDYIWFSSSTLQAKGVMETASEEEIKAGVPNVVFPSDHLSLKAVLFFK